jgi:Icc-related predicted phosphoesterase
MIIAHASDLHGSYKKLTKVGDLDFDLWLITGDFFPNYGRGTKTQGKIDPVYERLFQERWWSYKSQSIMDKLKGKPVIWIAGNHDFISLHQKLVEAKYCASSFDLSLGPVDFAEQRFSGYREIPFIAGEWPGESHDFSLIVQKAMDADPTILVTHAPPAGILDAESCGEHCGVANQTSAMTYQNHRITHHFFGHVHHCGGQVKQEMNITFVNSAKTIQLICI